MVLRSLTAVEQDMTLALAEGNAIMGNTATVADPGAQQQIVEYKDSIMGSETAHKKRSKIVSEDTDSNLRKAVRVTRSRAAKDGRKAG